MRNNRKPAIRWIALLLLAAYLFVLAGCGKKPAEQTVAPTQPTVPAQTEPHEHVYTDGVCQCGESNDLDGFSVQTAPGLAEVTLETSDSGVHLVSGNAAGDMQSILLNKEFDAVYGRYYEIVYAFTSNVSGTVAFESDGAAYYETNEYEIKVGENKLAIRFAAGKDNGGKVNTALALGGLEKFDLTIASVTCTELKSDLSPYFLDVAPEKADGTLEMNKDGHLAATYKTDEGWRVKLAVDRALVKGKTYETTFVFVKSGGKAQNVTYTVYDGAATIIGAKTKWVDSDICVATFYFTANESITKGTCLELGQLCGGEEVALTFTYIDFTEMDEEKLAKLTAANPFPGVNVWTEGALTPATGTQSAEGLTLVNTNAATDWWKVKLEQDMPAESGKFYKVTFKFNSDAAGRVKFVNDNATYYGTNEYDVQQGENTFTVELKSGGNTYSCLELGGLGPCKLVFTDITVEEIAEPSNGGEAVKENRFSSFRVWTESALKALKRSDTEKTMTITSTNAPADWWKVKVEKDINGKSGQWYEVTYTFTSNATGRIKFINDGATYYGSNEYDVVAGKNTFKVKFRYGGNPYSCLELGGLGQFKLVFSKYSLKKVESPEVVSNGFENYKAWTEASMKPLVRKDTATSMILTSENAPGDWWKVKLENNFALEAGKTYKAVYKFTSDAEGDIKFGTNENAVCTSADVYYVNVGDNQFEVTFTANAGAYTCLELGGLGNFQLTFTEITLTEVGASHTHSFVDGKCECGEENGFAGFHTWTEGALIPLTREDTENSMTLISTNAPADWWKVKLENSFALEAGKTYKAIFKFTSNTAGDIKFGTNENAVCTSADVYYVNVGDNQFEVTFTANAGAYTCLELGGLGNFQLTFTEISVKEVEVSG